MKRLLIALVAAVAVSTGFARLTDTQSFEDSFSDFVPDVLNQDDSELVAYDNDGPGFAAPYNFSNFGSKYLALDTGDATLWRTNAGEAAYFDMVMQFNPSANAPTLDAETKIAVYLNSSSNLVVLAGPKVGDDPTEYPYTTSTIAPGTWARLTIAKNGTDFDVYLNTTKIGTYASLTGDASIKSVGFKGSGALDDFVARTTDPYIQNPAVTIGGEGYASLADALTDDPTATPQLEADASYTIDARSGSVSVKLNNHTLTVTAPTGLYAYPTTSGDVTTYTADYFPRTATAGQDGTAAHPFEVADVDDLQALSAAVAADAVTFAGECYIQTADIDMASAGAFAGIGKYEKVPTSGTPFTGTYNGQGYTIANVTRAGGNTQGIFNQVGVGGVIENLVVSNMVFDAEVTGEYGFAIVGNAGGGATLRNLTAAGVFGAADKASTHNMAGIVVRVCGGATADVTTTIDSCTNNATVYGGYTKLGGICAIVQQQTGFTAGGVAFINCANNGNLICMRTKAEAEESAVTGNAGIIGYTSANNVELTGCSGMGTITNTNGANTDKDAALIGWQYTGYTLKDNGGNSAPANKKMIAYYGNVANVTGFQYATVDNGVATTVTGALAKDTVYLLERNVAASETPVFTLEAAGDTFKVDTALGYTFAGTVAAGSSLGVAGPKVAGTVSTYSAGVAAVDDVAYATFAEALAALDGATDTYVTLLANASTTFSEVGSIAVKRNGKTLDVNYGEFAGSESTDPSTGITTYTAVEGVAAIDDGGVKTWYATFADAYGAAKKSVNYPKMTIKVGEDFVPPISDSYDEFYSITFVATTEDPITAVLTNGANRMSAMYVYSVPENVKLVLPKDFDVPASNYLTGGGTVEVPEGVTLTLNPGTSGTLANLGGLVGAGTLVAPTDAGALWNFIASEKYSGWLKAPTWTGTVQLSGDMTGLSYTVSLANIANANASVRFSGFTNYVHVATSASSFGSIELVGDGLTLAGDYSAQNLSWTFANALKGDGTLDVAVTGNASGQYLKTIKFTGDVSGFSGNITFTDGASFPAFDVLIFGNDSSTASNAVVVSSGVVMTNATGKTWDALGGLIVNGTLVANGTITNALYGTGVYQASSTAAITPDESWTGTYVINWNPTGAFNPNDYGNENSVVALAKDLASKAYFGPGTQTTLTIEPTIRLDADVTIKNGYATTDKSCLVTFNKLTGSKKLTTFATENSNVVYYKINTLEDFTGSFDIKAHTEIEIGNVVLAAEPVADVCIVPVTLGAEKSAINSPTYTVTGSAATGTLEYKADGKEGAGLYVKAEEPSDDWNTPATDADVADSLVEDGITTTTDAVTTVEEFNALVAYITNNVSGVSKPANLTPNQKANAVLCYALNATTVPDKVIMDADVTIDSVAQAEEGGVALTVAIAGVTVGQTVDGSLLAKVVTAKGGTELDDMEASQVTVSGYGSADGKVTITVTPKKTNEDDPAPTSFFTSVIINK